MIFGSRSLSVKDVALPIRYLSDDGRCVFDVALRKGSLGDVSNGVGISRAANRVWVNCALDVASGGSARDFSTYREVFSSV